MIKKDDIYKLAELAKLSIHEDELEVYEEKLNRAIKSLEKIKEVNTDNVEITYNVNQMKNPLREDIVRESLSQNEVLKNTVEEQYGYFKILKVMD